MWNDTYSVLYLYIFHYWIIIHDASPCKQNLEVVAQGGADILNSFT